MELLMKSVGQPCHLFDSGDTFLKAYSPEWSGCLILDIRMPGIGGLELQNELQKRSCGLPVIFITGFGDVPMAVEAIKNGAFDFIEKPFRDQELLDRINAAIEANSQQRIALSETAVVKERLQRLTGREREVMDLVVTGKANKVIAHELGVSQRTVEIHRARVMEKMEAKSLPELVRMHLVN
ncbi:DNA-binding response regulator [Woeseia oceani]|uniref:DNA-binding response regulator n=2 Tax=Woeseia oceani TaxID=1548547 RepID=A0A193LE60_9GAMM|nr:DNA-binding response regulator [Woeseia oceani]